MINAIVEITGMQASRIQLQDLFLAEAGPPAEFHDCGLMPESIRTLPGVEMDCFMQCTPTDGRAPQPLPEDMPSEEVSW